MGFLRRRQQGAQDGSGTSPAADAPPALVEEARAHPGGWVYELDARRVQDPDEAVPPEAVIRAWEVGPDGVLTGNRMENPSYRP